MKVHLHIFFISCFFLINLYGNDLYGNDMDQDILENPRKQRSSVFLEMTRSLCSKCLVVDAKILKTAS